MSGAKYTEGPWEIIGEDSQGGVPFIDIGAGAMGTRSFAQICDVCSTLDEITNEFSITERDYANAHLIAAAPDMKECGDLLAQAAKDFLQEQTDINTERLALAAECWNTASAKATGAA